MKKMAKLQVCRKTVASISRQLVCVLDPNIHAFFVSKDLVICLAEMKIEIKEDSSARRSDNLQCGTYSDWLMISLNARAFDFEKSISKSTAFCAETSLSYRLSAWKNNCLKNCRKYSLCLPGPSKHQHDLRRDSREYFWTLQYRHLLNKNVIWNLKISQTIKSSGSGNKKSGNSHNLIILFLV